MSNAILDDDGWEERRRRVPLGRIGSLLDVVETALFLGSRQSSFLSGVTIPVDGGFSVAGMIPGIDLKNVSRTREGKTND
jgi:NAD(P)-dependent dehydrogenase (short-subunit alcohol dehydrogenase family)